MGTSTSSAFCTLTRRFGSRDMCAHQIGDTVRDMRGRVGTVIRLDPASRWSVGVERLAPDNSPYAVIIEHYEPAELDRVEEIRPCKQATG